jgi:hypothetical protein
MKIKLLKYIALAGILSIGATSMAQAAAVIIVRGHQPPPPPAVACVFANGHVKCYEYGHYVYYPAFGVKRICYTEGPSQYQVCKTHYCYRNSYGAKVCGSTNRLY